jgi:hypothetical protein
MYLQYYGTKYYSEEYVQRYPALQPEYDVLSLRLTTECISRSLSSLISHHRLKRETRTRLVYTDTVLHSRLSP